MVGEIWGDSAEVFARRGPLNLEDAPTTLSQQLGAIVDTGGDQTRKFYNWVGYQERLLSKDLLETFGVSEDEAMRVLRLVPVDQVNERVKHLGLRFDNPMTEYQINEAIFLREKQMRLDLIHERATISPYRGLPSRSLTFATELLMGAADPVNIATLMFPPLRAGPLVAGLRNVGITGAGTTAFATGLYSNAVWNTVFEVPQYFAERHVNPDYSFTNSLINVAFGTVLGGGLHWLGSKGEEVRAYEHGLLLERAQLYRERQFERAIYAPDRFARPVEPPPAAPVPRIAPEVRLGREGSLENVGIGTPFETSRWEGMTPPTEADQRFMMFAPTEHALAPDVAFEVRRAADWAANDPYRPADIDTIVRLGTEDMPAVPQRAAAAAQALSAETRQNVLTTALGQLGDNRAVDVEPILKADPSYRPGVEAVPKTETALAAQQRELPPDVLQEATAEMRQAIADATKPTPVPDSWVAPPDLLQQARRLVRGLPAVATRTAERGRQSLSQWVRAKGGVRVGSTAAGDLVANDLGGLSGLLRKNGRNIDDLALAAVEEGFYPAKIDETGEIVQERAESFLSDLIDDANGSRRLYRPDDEAVRQFDDLVQYNEDTKRFLQESGVDPRSMDARELAWLLSFNDRARREFEALARGVDNLTELAAGASEEAAQKVSQELMLRLDEMIFEAQTQHLSVAERSIEGDPHDWMPAGSEPITREDFDRLWAAIDEHDAGHLDTRAAETDTRPRETGVPDAEGRDVGGAAGPGEATLGIDRREGDVAVHPAAAATDAELRALEDQAAAAATGLRRVDEGTGRTGRAEGAEATVEPAGAEGGRREVARPAAAEGPLLKDDEVVPILEAIKKQFAEEEQTHELPYYKKSKRGDDFSGPAFEMAQGWRDAENGIPPRARYTQPFQREGASTFDPVNSYLMGYMAKREGYTPTIRASDNERMLQYLREAAPEAPPPATPRPREDVGPEGLTQTVLPGAERIADRELAERRMQQPMRGGREAPPEGGLFDEGARAQRDMFDVRHRAQSERMDADEHSAFIQRQGDPANDMHADVAGYREVEAEVKSAQERDAEQDFKEVEQVMGAGLSAAERAEVDAIGKLFDDDVKAIEQLGKCLGGGGG